MVDPCAHMEVVQVLAMEGGEVVVHDCHSGYGVSGNQKAIAAEAVWVHTLECGTKPRAGVLTAQAAGWGKGHSEGILLGNVGKILLRTQEPLGSEVQGRGDESSPLHSVQGRIGCDNEVVLKEPGHCSRMD